MQTHNAQKLRAGISFPDIKVQMLDGTMKSLGKPELEALANGLSFIRKNDYPIRGTHD